MRSVRPVVIALSFLCFQAGIALAEDSPKTTATRPAREHPNEISLPNNAPPVSSKQTTGSTNQSPMVKEMNAEELEKVKKEGK